VWSAVEKVATVVLFGLVPPYPIELQAEYAEAADAKRSELRREHTKRVYRFYVALAVVAFAMIAQWMWGRGLLVAIGATAGYAHAADVQKQQAAQTTAVAQFSQRMDKFEKRSIEENISRLDSEAFQLDSAISSARRAGRAPDELHVKRRTAITTERGRLVEQLAALSPEAAAAVRSQ
jgi:hypothetical protein